jgi:hypothetical protein
MAVLENGRVVVKVPFSEGPVRLLAEDVMMELNGRSGVEVIESLSK